jgi:23S rRNA (adenine2030-N6)-methyltransferase
MGVMFAYRHAFHAGNHADVLKHVMLVHVLRHMAAKPKPFTLVDSHAGAGGYALGGKHAQRKAEYETGIGRLWQRADAPPAVADYVRLVRDFNGGGALEQYPGSPALAQMLLRPDDRLRLYEMHPTDHRTLESLLGRRAHAKVSRADGFAAVKAELPPPSRRGVLLIDPSYELKTDYAKTLAAVREALERFAECVVLAWVPQLQLLESAQLPTRLVHAAAAAPRGWLHARLTVQRADVRGFGMIGSSVVAINPPHTLHDALRVALPWLAAVLGRFDGANFLLEQGAG